MWYVLLIVVGGLFNWLPMVVVLPFAAKWSGFGMPGLREFLWKTAVIATAAAAADMLVDLTGIPLIGWLASLIVVWTLLSRWFDAGPVEVVLVLVLISLLQQFVVLWLVLSLSA